MMNFGLLQQGQPNALALAVQGFETGRAMGREVQEQRLLQELGRNPGNAQAMERLYGVNPRLAAAMEDQAYQRSERGRETRGRNALADYMLASDQAAAPSAPAAALSSATAPVPNALAGPMASPAGPQSLLPGGYQESAPVGGGQPRQANPRNSAWAEAVRSNPRAALEARRAFAQMTDDEVKAYSSINARAYQELQGATDQASWEAGLARMERTFARFGMETPDLPRQFSPELRDSAIRSTLQSKDYLTAERQDRRLDWDIEDDMIDNEALEDYRGETIRVQERGQDIASRDRVRGQDLSDERGRRGQDMTDQRGRRGQDISSLDRRRGQDMRRRGGRGRSGNATAGNGPVARGPDGRAAVVRNGRWVDAETGRPIQ